MLTHVSIQNWLTKEAKGLLKAHTAKEGNLQQDEMLEEHSDLVMHHAEVLMKDNGVEAAVYRALDRLSVDEEPLDESVRELMMYFFRQAIYVHDLGKVNPAFQRMKMNNTEVKRNAELGDSNHSMLSAVLYLHIHLRHVQEWHDTTELYPNRKKHKRKVLGLLHHMLYSFAYTISRHHTHLGNMDQDTGGQINEFELKIKNQYNRIKENPDYIRYYRDQQDLIENDNVFEDIRLEGNKRQNKIHSPFPFYVLVKLLYSTMVASDFRATYQYMEQQAPEMHYFGDRLPLEPMLEAYRQTGIVQGIQAYCQNPEKSSLSMMNQLRAELFVETQTRLLDRLQEPVFYLEAPTGSGKTNMSINLALHLLNSGLGLNKLIYVFPFNSLIEQTRQTLDGIFYKVKNHGYQVEVINSITPMVTTEESQAEASSEWKDKEPDNTDYKRVLLERQLLQYPVTLTSHVNFFNYLFGTGREVNLAFAHLCNSVIVLDEIQSYRNELWKEIIHFLRSFADILNIKIIIMSATLPNLDLLMEQQDHEKPIQTYSLVQNRERYFTHSLFRDRVKLDFNLLKRGKMLPEQILEHVQSVIEQRKRDGQGNRILIEFITKKTARQFYNMLLEQNLGLDVYELTGDDSSSYRQELLEKLGKDAQGSFYLSDVIVVATQVIEAGVDIDMDVGFKDISLLDSEEQFLGRLNRSCLRDYCQAYFFDCDEASGVYRKDLRITFDLKEEAYQKMLETKDFSEFYKSVITEINKSRQKPNQQYWGEFTEKVQKLEFPDVQKHMDLIPDKSVTLFLNYTCPMKDAPPLNGQDVWDEFVRLSDKRLGMDYSERMIRLSEVRAQMNHFSYTYRIQEGKEARLPICHIGTLYFVSEGEKYMEWDELTRTKKFNRAKYVDDVKK
ncbi:CRISPR-associated protein [Paenibacillus sp. IHB B 3084]|uniref:CRISPR-associated helicase Cas3' n=1 Tax=Paenibacillus sp. IHB B 3084 TaxID=867076 RepID=UPI00072241CB|nr:CRISPR-associated helicase Cas3' [Paenibacillus sp. IHB B 3084]ALP35653.1 CRISPR-associated protein [Paenibacillus sp. IHB B 3084]